MTIMNVLALIKHECKTFVMCESPTTARYITNGNGALLLYTPKIQSESEMVVWDKGIAEKVIKSHNDKSQFIKLKL